MNRDDVDWRGYWPACPTPFTAGGAAVDTDVAARARRVVRRPGDARHLRQRDDAASGSRRRPRSAGSSPRPRSTRSPAASTVVIGCTSLTAKRGGRARPARDGRRRRRASARRRRRTRRRIPDETVRYFQDISDGVDAPLMVYNWPHGTSVDIGPDLAERIAAVDNVVAIKDSTPNLEQFFETTKRVLGPRARVRPVHERRRASTSCSSTAATASSAAARSGAPATPSFWEAVWRGDLDAAREHARAHRRAVPEALAAGRLGRAVRRLPEPAQGADEDARPARAARCGRRACRSPTRRASRRMREILVEAACSPSRWRRREHLPWESTTSASASATSTRRSSSTAAHVGFDRVLFDYTGELPRLEAFAGRTPRARVAMLESSGATPIGPGRVKLVQVLDGDGPPPVPDGQAWGEVGVCEICLHVRDVQAVHDALVAAGCASLMEPMSADVPPTRRHARHRLRRRPVGDEARDDRVDGALALAAGPGPRRGRQPRRLRRHRHGAHARVLRAARVHRAALRVGRVLRPDGAVVRGALVRPGRPARPST